MKFLGPPSSGSIAATTFAHTRGGQYTRARNGRGGTGMPAMASAVAAWQALTLDEQRAWSMYSDQRPRAGRLGPRTLAGYNAFTASFLALDAAGVTPGTTPPAPGVFRLKSVALTAGLAQFVNIVAFAKHAGAGDPGFNNKLLCDTSGAPVSTGITFPPGRNGWKRQHVFTVTDSMFVAFATPFASSDVIFTRVREMAEDGTIGPPWWTRLTLL